MQLCPETFSPLGLASPSRTRRLETLLKCLHQINYWRALRLGLYRYLLALLLLFDQLLHILAISVVKLLRL